MLKCKIAALLIVISGCSGERLMLKRENVNVKQVRIYAYQMDPSANLEIGINNIDKIANYIDTITDKYSIDYICEYFDSLEVVTGHDEAFSLRALCVFDYSNGENVSIAIDNHGHFRSDALILEDSYVLLSILGLHCLLASSPN